MRRIVIAIASTITGLVLLFSWPTSLNRGAALAAQPAAGGTGSGTSSGSTGSTGTSSGTSGGSGASSGTGKGSTSAQSGSSAKDGTYTGGTAQTRYGPVTVQITVKGGAISDAQATNYPNGSRTDQRINAYAIPVLNQEVVQAGNANIQMVSGATFTSYGYLQSLQSALDKAGL
ncbi:FMN-binding protein [Isoptericola sp. b441]|uniref:FMN-binding protein n=1 Tax=Actinotalea lenta TaxID=3064654 RepID=A0ABT9D6H2_9CELL|nr:MULTISPECIES: FMN-binding protein [unclassified Isoptericola]MDO8106411.1 FMN-binding protein [Isoptericola sp. b441]MDO8121884.1 FMN-binding protein [Isoptericola sp. b490]